MKINTRNMSYELYVKNKHKQCAHVKCIASAEAVKELSSEELDARIEEAFSFDNFAWQRDT